MTAGTVSTKVRLLRIYYAGTVIFLILDYFLGINVRLAALEQYPGVRAWYYLICFAFFALIIWRPGWSSWIAASESLLTLSLLIINMALRVIIVTDDMIESGRGAVTISEIINFMLASGIAYVAWMRHSTAAFRGADTL